MEFSDDKERKKAQGVFFKNVYELLIGKEKGPRLYLFLFAINKNDYLPLLDFSTPQTEKEKALFLESQKSEEPQEEEKREVEAIKPQIEIDDFDKLDLSVPRGRVPSPLYKQTTITFNPWSETHWLKKRFFDVQSSNVKTFSTNYLCNEFLDETDRLIFERMKQTNRRKYEVAGLGNWGISEGLVFENWSVGEIHIPSDEEYMWKSFFGLDYGYTNDPTAFVAFKANPITKQIYIYKEFYKTRMLNCDIAEQIKALGFAKERIRADCAEPKSNDDLRRLGISRITPSVKGRDSILNGISAICEYQITVNPACVNMIRELSSYVYDDKRSENGLKMPKDSENHLCDALRYAFEDVKFFKPFKKEKRSVTSSEISNKDINGGWDL
jgi:PBSX family phage terminase large subunit